MIGLDYNSFKPIELSDRELIESYLRRADRMSCEVNFCNIFNWGPVYNYRFAVVDDLLVVTLDSAELLFPCGRNVVPTELVTISDLLRDAGSDGDYIDVPAEYVDANRAELEKYFELDSCEDDYDYIYSVDKLVELGGSRLRKKRNLISQFEREYRDWDIKELTAATATACIPFIEYIYRDTGMDDMQKDDFAAVKRAVKFFGRTGLRGQALYVGSEMAAFSLFSRQNSQTYTVHFEKSDKEVKGSSQVINQATARLLQGECRYLNREQDLGVEGLRHAKQSYEPEFMLKNYNLIRKG